VFAAAIGRAASGAPIGRSVLVVGSAVDIDTTFLRGVSAR
jgi:hypothetical protein